MFFNIKPVTTALPCDVRSFSIALSSGKAFTRWRGATLSNKMIKLAHDRHIDMRRHLMYAKTSCNYLWYLFSRYSGKR